MDNHQITGDRIIVASLAAVDGSPMDSTTRRDEFKRELNAFVRKWFPHWEAKDIG